MKIIINHYNQKGLGIATSKYPEGWGINLYSGPGKGAWFTGHVINTKMPYLIIDAAWYGGNENMFMSRLGSVGERRTL